MHLISEYESKGSELPEVDPVEMIKILMEDFGYKSADLAEVYGDKGTISKVLNYKQSLSLNMIRKFSKQQENLRNQLVNIKFYLVVTCLGNP